jgi:hypothetical protein
MTAKRRKKRPPRPLTKMQIAQAEWLKQWRADPEGTNPAMPGWRQMTDADLKRAGLRIWEPLPKVDLPPDFDIEVALKRLGELVAMYDAHEASKREAVFAFFRKDNPEPDPAALTRRLAAMDDAFQAQWNEATKDAA